MLRYQLRVPGLPITVDLGNDQHGVSVHMQFPYIMLECNLESQDADFILCLIVGAGEGHLPGEWDQLSLRCCQNRTNALAFSVDGTIEIQMPL